MYGAPWCTRLQHRFRNASGGRLAVPKHSPCCAPTHTACVPGGGHERAGERVWPIRHRGHFKSGVHGAFGMVFLRLENIEISRNVPETKGASKREDGGVFFGTGEEEVRITGFVTDAFIL